MSDNDNRISDTVLIEMRQRERRARRVTQRRLTRGPTALLKEDYRDSLACDDIAEKSRTCNDRARIDALGAGQRAAFGAAYCAVN